ncbi:hypothetical protein BJ322DRAFT_1111476 [Thelephora terrestris]|uniref:Uncharacterized protein n=1 Tax=Thelephora terrestris TaxID=56493 RepID=A0A9P6L3D8_9AGAM|nr:hypothetical protein BJ322DRAFT_1111476 [Thelephora terrestris]
MHPNFKEVSNPSAQKSHDSYFAFRRVRSTSATPTPSPSPPPGPTRTGSAPDSSIRGRDVGKKRVHKEKLKLVGSDDSNSGALTQSGDEAEESSPPLQDQPKPGTEGDTEVGEDVEMAERSSPEPVPVVKQPKAQKTAKKGASARTRSSVAAALSRPTKKRKR